jgi:hypothetical protein
VITEQMEASEESQMKRRGKGKVARDKDSDIFK